MIRRGQKGQPMETVLTNNNASLQVTDGFLLDVNGGCPISDVVQRPHEDCNRTVGGS